MSHTANDLGLRGYKNWVKSLEALPNGTVIKFAVPYVSSTIKDSIDEGKEFMIVDVDEGMNFSPVYKMVAHRNGKLFKRIVRFSVESIARRLIDNECVVM